MYVNVCKQVRNTEPSLKDAMALPPRQRSALAFPCRHADREITYLVWQSALRQQPKSGVHALTYRTFVDHSGQQPPFPVLMLCITHQNLSPVPSALKLAGMINGLFFTGE